MAVYICSNYITRKIIQDNPDKLFLFGDNEQRSGFGGQAAVARGEPNAAGVRTKCYPSMSRTAFWSDLHKDIYFNFIDEDLQPAYQAVNEGRDVIIINGIGEGCSKLYEKAPLVYKYLKRRLAELQEYAETFSKS